MAVLLEADQENKRLIYTKKIMAMMLQKKILMMHIKDIGKSKKTAWAERFLLNGLKIG